MLFLWHAHWRPKQSQSWTIWRWKESSRSPGEGQVSHTPSTWICYFSGNSPKINCKKLCLVGEGVPGRQGWRLRLTPFESWKYKAASKTYRPKVLLGNHLHLETPVTRSEFGTAKINSICYRSDSVPSLSLSKPAAIKGVRFSITPDVGGRWLFSPRCLSTSQWRASQKAHRDEGCPRYLWTDTVSEIRSSSSGPQATGG